MADDKNKNKKHFFKDMKTELKKVTWLTPKQLLNNTTAVIVMVVIVAAIVFVLDFTFENLNSQGVERLKAVVQTNTVDNTVDNTTSDNTTSDTDANTTADENNTVDENSENSNETQE